MIFQFHDLFNWRLGSIIIFYLFFIGFSIYFKKDVGYLTP